MFLCAGHACYDLIFQVPHHPQSDEKISSTAHYSCGGGPAANAAVAISRLGLKSEFIGYLGNDIYGESHLAELTAEGVDTSRVMRGSAATPVATLIVKPDGKRSVVNYTQADTMKIGNQLILDSQYLPSVMLFDGHQPDVSAELIRQSRHYEIPTILDAGSLHTGTRKLMNQVDYLAASEKFACQYTGLNNPEAALQQMSHLAPVVIITLSEHGLLWSRHNETGRLPAFNVQTVDSTGAGDAFHAGLATALALQKPWEEALVFASAVAALCCTRIGARPGMPDHHELSEFLQMNQLQE